MENVNLEGYRKNMTKKEFIENVIDEGNCVIRFGLPGNCDLCSGNCDTCCENALGGIQFKDDMELASLNERKADIDNAVKWAMNEVEDVRPFVSYTLNAPETKRVAYKKLADAINDRRFDLAIEILRELNK